MKETKDRVCVGGVLIRTVDHGRDESALVLLGRRAANREFYPDVWDVPGGHLELADPSYPEILRGAASLVSGAAWRGRTASKIASSGRRE